MRWGLDNRQGKGQERDYRRLGKNVVGGRRGLIQQAKRVASSELQADWGRGTGLRHITASYMPSGLSQPHGIHFRLSGPPATERQLNQNL